ncbi:two-component system, chemotaxis family, sensor kinase CheA [Roseivivax lentus]|uniref:Chemotaxis protein CheA n=1 Tax=Roseivivax lentus TaxID=633194 RepID=A0A1N7MRA3_9RHOB|nr:chemotaxis protein CheA [Roseivivax lentus]SIS88665.1 two-component system, chemotaxis family, sensor kinase CheA [Roseivivax lentus]
MSSLDELRWTFFLECAELLEALDDGFDQLSEADPGDPLDLEEVNAVFRSVHSIKGGAASFGLEELVRFAHEFETVLDAMRAGRLTPDRDDWRVLRQSGDVLAELVAAARDGVGHDAARQAEIGRALGAMIGAHSEATPALEDATDAPIFAPTPIGLDGAEAGEAIFAPLALDLDDAPMPSETDISDPETPGLRLFEIRFAPQPSLFENGHDPVHLFRELSDMGRFEVTVDHSALPDAPQPMRCYLNWRIALETRCDEEDIREIFEFVDPLADIAISRVNAPGTDAAGPGATSTREEPGTPDPLDALLVDPSAIPAAPSTPAAKASPGPAQKQASRPTHAAGSPAPQEPKASQKTPSVQARKSTVRVDLGLVDDLINIVGELVINQSFLSQSIIDAGLSGRTQVSAGLDEFKNLARQIQEGVMSIRAQSVKPLFQRMARIVREASAVAGKPVRFETSGETTEVDTTVIERLIDPLTHILRNAVDHGLESAEARSAAGKPSEGAVRLSADHRSGRVLIEISDDGGGINRPKVLAIAKEKGLVAPDATPPDEEIDRLLFKPGFSTADVVTDLSGRGVGMDVVRSAIQKLGGRISIASEPGRGTTISISLPLTLAVLEGMVVKVVGQTMVVPINAIIETLRPGPEDIEPLTEGAEVIRVRDQLVPIVDLGLVFGYPRTRKPAEERVLLLVETEQGRRWALSVDEIRDQRQVVIKSLEENYGRVPGVAAATILGDGRIALIIDPEEAIRTATGLDLIANYPNSAATKKPEAQHVDA